MMRLLFLILVAVFPAAVNAQNVVVRGGEHPTFTRLVLPFAEPTSWQISRDGAVVRFVFSPAPPGFDLSRAFDLIPRTRLQVLEVTQNQSELRLQLACDCPVEAFEFRSNSLVFDILDRSPQALNSDIDAQIQAPPDLWVSSAQASGPRLPVFARSDPDQLVRKRAPPRLDVPFAIPVETAPSEPTLGSDLREALLASRRQGDVAERLDLVTGNASLIAEGLARAASQGIVSVDPVADLSQRDFAVEGSLANQPNLRVRTRAEIDLGDVADLLNDIERAECRTQSTFDLIAWSRPEDPWSGVGAARAMLFDALDRVQPDAVRALARAYLSLGLGLEARQTLEVFAYEGNDKDLLVAMSHLLEGDDQESARLLEAQVFCETGPVTLGFLSGAKINDVAPISSDALERFMAFPALMRRQQAAPMIRRLLDVERADLAYLVFADLERSYRGDPSDIDYLRRAVESGQPGVSDLDRRPREASEFAAALATTEDPAQAELDLLRAYQTEFRDTKLKTQLNEAEVRALIAAGQYSEAFEKIKERVDQDIWVSAILEGILDRGNDGDVLVYAPWASRLPLDGIGSDTRTDYEARLAGLGFAGLLAGNWIPRPERPVATQSAELRVEAGQDAKRIERNERPTPQQLLVEAERVRALQ